MPKKWERDLIKRKYEEHKQRLRDMKPSVDDKKPKEMMVDKRKNMIREKLLETVQLDNRILLTRLGKAMERKNIDNDLQRHRYLSLTEENRIKTLKKVNADNLRLLDRIQHVEPYYKIEEWEKDAEKREKVLEQRTEFPQYFVARYSPSRQILRAQRRIREAQGVDSGVLIPPPDGDPSRNGVLRPITAENRKLPGTKIPLPRPFSAADVTEYRDRLIY